MNKLNKKLSSAGVGFIVIPEDVDKKTYVKNCYRTCRVSINGGYGHGIYRGIHIPMDVIQQIKFPDDYKSFGSAVVWVKDGQSGQPVVIACLVEEDDYYSLGSNKFRKVVKNGNNIVDLFMDGNKSSLQINITDDGNNPSEVIVKLGGKNKKSVFKILSDNEINLSADNKINLLTDNEIYLESSLEDKIVSLKFNQDGILYKDSFENEIAVKDGEINIKSKKINFGEGKSQVVLGNELIKLLEDLCSACSSITVPTPAGPSGIPVNAAQFTVIKGQLKSTLSDLTSTD